MSKAKQSTRQPVKPKSRELSRRRDRRALLFRLMSANLETKELGGHAQRALLEIRGDLADLLTLIDGRLGLVHRHKRNAAKAYEEATAEFDAADAAVAELGWPTLAEASDPLCEPTDAARENAERELREELERRNAMLQ